MLRHALLILSALLAGTAVDAQTGQFSIPLANGLTLHLTVAPFDSAAHTISGYDERFVYAIDGRPFFGSDGELPRSMAAAAELEVAGKRVALDVSGMFNPWLQSEPFQVEQYGSGWKIRGLFSDGAGSYMTEWLVIDGGSIRTVLTNDERVIAALLYDGQE